MRNFLKQVRTWIGLGQPKSGLKIQKGFSLIELLVAITIGGIILTVVMVSYVAMVQTNLRLDIARQMQKEINFTAIRIADRVRNYSINLGEGESNSGKLVIGKTGEIFEFLSSSKKLTMCEQSLFSDKIAVDMVEFSYPDPEENNGNFQPWVQVYLKISSRKEPEIKNWIRTTISSRIFE